MTLEDVKNSLEANPNLTDEIRILIYALIDIFNKKYPNINLTNLVNHLKTLRIEKSNKFLNKRVSSYDYKNNVLEFNVDRINEGFDMKHIMMGELLNIITNNGEMTGFNKYNNYRALNAGYTEILANNLVGNESDISYLEHEIITANQIALLVSDDIMFKAFFTNNVEIIVDEMFKKGFGETYEPTR